MSLTTKKRLTIMTTSMDRLQDSVRSLGKSIERLIKSSSMTSKEMIQAFIVNRKKVRILWKVLVN
jgi:hypothetical protein